MWGKVIHDNQKKEIFLLNGLCPIQVVYHLVMENCLHTYNIEVKRNLFCNIILVIMVMFLVAVFSCGWNLIIY